MQIFLLKIFPSWSLGLSKKLERPENEQKRVLYPQRDVTASYVAAASRLLLIGWCVLMYCGSYSGMMGSATCSMCPLMRESKTFLSCALGEQLH